MPLLEGVVLSMQAVPQATPEPGQESATSGVTFVCLLFFPPERLCASLTAKGNTSPVIPGHGTACLWICAWAEPWCFWAALSNISCFPMLKLQSCSAAWVSLVYPDGWKEVEGKAFESDSSFPHLVWELLCD